MVDSTSESKTETDLLAAQRLISRIILEYAGQAGFEDVVTAAKTELSTVEERLKLFRNLSQQPADSVLTPATIGEQSDEPADSSASDLVDPSNKGG